MKRLVLAGVVGSTMLVGCISPGHDEDIVLASDDHAIIGGIRSVGVTATVMLAGFPPDRSILHACTAVVVAPTVLLTAAHCIDAPNHPSYMWGVFTGDDASPYPNLAALEPELRMAASVHPHPQYSPDLPFYADIGVVVMAAPLPNTPLPLQRDALDATVVGKPALIVGYGQTVYEQFNQARHEAMTTVAALEDDTLVIGDNQRRACLGDSGGPAIVEGRVVGVDSYGPVGCTGPAHYRRVDSFLPFIDTYVPPPGTEPPPDEDPPVGADPVDGGGCDSGRGTGPAGLGVTLVLGLFVARPRRRRRG